MDKLSQQGKILKLLKENNKLGFPNYNFPKYGILKYNARISELRQDGHAIVAVRDKLDNGRSTGVWRYYLND